jgi:hypothetical protein
MGAGNSGYSTASVHQQTYALGTGMPYISQPKQRAPWVQTVQIATDLLECNYLDAM